MDRILTLIVALMATVSVMAQKTGAMNFIGSSDYTASVWGQTISGHGVKDTLVIADANSSITFPDMNVLFMGQKMTVPSMKIANLVYTMKGNPMTGSAVFTWDKGETDTTVVIKIDGAEQNKTLKISSLHAVYTHSTGTLDVAFSFQYGSMPGIVTFTETGYYTIDNAWNLVGRGTSANPYRLFNAADFTSMADNISATNTGKGEFFQMMNDIDFGGTADSPVLFPSIGIAAVKSATEAEWGFQGTFDGCDKTISGIYDINDNAYHALFASLGEGGAVKNVVLDKSNIVSAGIYASPFACIKNGGIIDNCVNNATVLSTGVSEVSTFSTRATYKTLINGRLVIINGSRQYTPSGALMK